MSIKARSALRMITSPCKIARWLDARNGETEKKKGDARVFRQLGRTQDTGRLVNFLSHVVYQQMKPVVLLDDRDLREMIHAAGGGKVLHVCDKISAQV